MLSLLTAATGLALPLVVRALIDDLGHHRSVAELLLLMTGLVVANAALGALGGYVLRRTAESVVLAARRRLVDRLLGLTISGLDRAEPGDLMSRVSSDTTLLRDVTTGSIVGVVTGGLTLIATLVLMSLLDPVLFGVTVGVFSLAAVVIGVVVPRIGRAARRAQDSVGVMGAALERMLGAFRTVKASGAEQREGQRVHAAAREAWRADIRAAKWEAIAGNTAGLSIQCAFIAVLATGGEHGAPAAVTFEQVRFRYRRELPEVHHGISFAIPPRGMTAFVGPSGAGKTTVFSLIERFYEPDAGRILLDGTDLRDWPIPELRAAIGYVEQDAPVLSGSLRENLILGAPDATDAEVGEVLRITRLTSLVTRLPEGLQTAVGHRGTRLSGGTAVLTGERPVIVRCYPGFPGRGSGPYGATSGNSAIDAVKACRKFCPATGPSSPAQKNPATGISPSIFASSPASWSGSENSRDPRPLQVNSSAPAARRPPRAVDSRSRVRRRSSSAESASRTWNCTVRPTSTPSPTAMAPESGSAPATPRIRKSPWRGSARYSSMTSPT